MITEKTDEILEALHNPAQHDTILCHDKKDAMKMVDIIGSRYIEDWDLLPDGHVKLYLNTTLSHINFVKEVRKKHAKKN